MKLLGTEPNGTRLTRYYQHYNNEGKKEILIHNTEDVEPAFEKAKMLRELRGKGKELRFITHGVER